MEQLVRVCKEEGLIGVLGFNLMTENTGFIDELIRLGTENEAVTKWIDNFYSQVNSSTMVEERNRSLAQICNWNNDMAQLVQIELLKEIHEELNSGNKNRPKVQDQLCRIEKKVTEAFSNNELAKSFLEKVKAPNSKEFLRSHLFPKILLEKVTNVNPFSTILCKTCSFKFRKDDVHYEQKASPKIGYSCLAKSLSWCAISNSKMQNSHKLDF